MFLDIALVYTLCLKPFKIKKVCLFVNFVMSLSLSKIWRQFGLTARFNVFVELILRPFSQNTTMNSNGIHKNHEEYQYLKLVQRIIDTGKFSNQNVS